MIEIKPIEPQHIPDAKRVIVSVAHKIFQEERSPEEMLKVFDERGEFQDIDQAQEHYLDRGGQFLVALDAGQVIGTGALRPIDDTTCELRRLWLLETYHGQGIGFRLMQLLTDFARQAGYQRMRLITDQRQVRAIQFYQRLGFQFIERYHNTDRDVFMELVLGESSL